MATVKIVLRKKKNKDGTFPLSLRITKDRKSSFIHLGHHILPSQWDAAGQRVKKSHPNSTRLNNLLTKKLSEGSDKLLEMEIQKNDLSSQTLKNGLKPTTGTLFNGQADYYIQSLKQSGKYNRCSADAPRINRFKEFLKGRDISFPEITVSLLDKFKNYLKATRTIKERTVVNHLVVIRTIYSQAIKAGVVDPKYYPFGKDKVRIRFPESIKIGLSMEEVNRIEELVFPQNSLLNHGRNLWLFSFYFAGMRASDVLRLRWSDFQDNRLQYTMGKNAKTVSLKVPEKALKILAEYEKDKNHLNDLVFPDLKKLESFKDNFIVQQKIANAIKRLDMLLDKVAKEAKIEKKFTMHIARHTFGNISGDKISIQMLQKLYRHSSITTTIGYQGNFTHMDADEALDSVLKQ
jgi:integrase/recombinase XerD